MNDIYTSVCGLRRNDYDPGELRGYFGQFKTLVRKMLRESGVAYQVVEE